MVVVFRFFLSVVFFLVYSTVVHAQLNRETTMNELLDSIRHNQALLTSFFSSMPKGADLHHHYDGSIYAEHAFDFALQDGNFVVDSSSDIIRRPFPSMGSEWKQIKSFSPSEVILLKNRFLSKASTLNYTKEKSKLTSAEHFFTTFSYTIPIVTDSAFFSRGLALIKQQALRDKVMYVESIIPHIPTEKIRISGNKDIYNSRIKQLNNQRDADGLYSFFDYIIQRIDRVSIEMTVEHHNNRLLAAHLQADIDETAPSFFVMRYQNWINRNVDNTVDVFLEFLAAFQSASTSNLLVGVNIVTPEHGEVAMKDYWLHMQMYKYFRKRFPDVQCSIHAGEFNSSMIDFTHYGNHIELAIHEASANRIGHGTSIHLETNHQQTLATMKEKNIPVEICLSSNEFILGVGAESHPVLLYHYSGVPIVLCTDGLGVLRTSLTAQYVLLAYRYPSLSYQDIKKIALGSVSYAHTDQKLKDQMYQQLEQEFRRFEE